MKIVLLLSVCVAVALATPAAPVFPTSWYSPQYSGVMVMGGSGISLKGASYFQADNGFQRSAYIASNGGQSTFGDYDGKTYGGQPSLYYFDAGYSCNCWCPVQTDDQCGDASSLCRYDLMNNLTYANSTTVFGLPVNLFTADDYLGPIDMAQNALYVLDNAAVPVYRWQRLTPFGTYQGNITQVYGGFTAGPSPIDWAKVVPNAQYCQQCDESQCPSGGKLTLHGMNEFMLKRMMMMAEKK